MRWSFGEGNGLARRDWRVKRTTIISKNHTMVENKQDAPAEMKREKEKTKQNHVNFNHS